MRKTAIQRDAAGLFVCAGGTLYRPGAVTGWSHAFDIERRSFVDK